MSSAQIIADRAICNTAAIWPSKTVALAASRIYRWNVANKFWDRVRVDLLDSNELLLMTTSLLRNRRWQDASNVTIFATAVGKGTIQLELANTEALWRLGDSEAMEASRERAIGYLSNPTPAELSLIRNENQIVNITSRLELLWATAPSLDAIRAKAQSISVSLGTESAFTFWDSGIEKAPAIVKVCRNQMRSVYQDSLVELDNENLSQWLPEEPDLQRVAKLWPANFSDAIRVGLLARHGGVWLDATILTGENSLAKAKSHDLQLFRYNGPRIASWFMVAKPGSYQARMLYAAMLDYWQRNRKLKNYFLFHDLVEVLYHLDRQFKAAFEKEENLDARPSLAVQRQLWKPFDEAAFKSALATRPIQKLTYKIDGKEHGKATTYGWLVQGLGSKSAE